ncbi:MAG: L,D-transpeptidase family protein [Pseudomonadota bacterium]|nr:L,D-transpeptidase family protein [Pseudomonadota bacterium]
MSRIHYFPFGVAAIALLSLTACEVRDAGEEKAATADTGPAIDPMGSNDDPNVAPPPEDKPRPLMQAQVVLDRLGFTPGVVDGKMGMSTVNALKGFQEARGLPVTGELDQATQQALAQWKYIPATRVVTIPAEFASDRYVRIPEEREDQAKLDRMGYESLREKVAERFHTTEEVLAELNAQPAAAPAAAQANETAPQGNEAAPKPAALALRPGMQLRVPNIGADRFDPSAVKDPNWANMLRMLGVGTAQAKAAKIEVDKSDQVLRVLDGQGKLVAQFTATMGSSQFPLPLGTWKIRGVAYNPPWQYDPALLANADKDDPKLEIPPGPNNPIGVVWIDLSKEHYGIHGTDEPNRIGRAESNGCIRLTNWDAARLAQMVSPGVEAVFKA